MMNKIGEIKFKEIKSISPSQFYSMKNCPYKLLLAEAFDKKPLLPPSPSAYFGTVIHKMLELIAKGMVKNENDFNEEFDKQVKILEDNLQSNGLGFFVPIKAKSRNFGLKIIQLKKHLRYVITQPPKTNKPKFPPEKRFESQDKLIIGKFDLIIENGNDIEIIDFKTGVITEDSLDDFGELYTDVKIEYKEQLKLYAYLFFENTNKFPTNLSLVDLAKNKYPVEFSFEECKDLFEDAKQLLKLTNESIYTNSFKANPNVENCKYCLYRPACSFYHKKLEVDFSFNDLFGEIVGVKKYHNGNVSVFLQNGNKISIIKNMSSEVYNVLNSIKGKSIRVYNLRKESVESYYSALETTKIYE